MPKCTIDGKEIEVTAGTTVLQAALDHGIDIQYFCWHPDLGIDGNCRTCMVEIEKMPRVQIACNTTVTEGMVVRTNTDKAHAAQRSALELAAHQPPDRLPGVRPGRRVLPPGQLHALRPLRLRGGDRGEGQEAQGPGPRADHAGRRALRAVHPLRALRGAGHGHEQPRVPEPRRPQGDRHLQGPAHHPRLRGQPGRPLPGGRAPEPRLPLQDAGLVPEIARVDLPGLLHRLQHRGGRARRRRAALPRRAATPT